MRININNDAVIAHVNRLEKLHRSGLPLAIRGTLNSTAFDVKQNTMLKTANQAFVNRDKNFFKANSRVEMAKGFDVRSMKSAIGFTDTKLRGDNNFAVKNLEQQEFGGRIDGKSFIPKQEARISKSSVKKVSTKNRLTRIKKIVKTEDVKGANEKERFVKSVLHAGKGGAVLSKFRGSMILWRVNSLNKTSTGQFKLTPLYSFEPGRKVKVDPTNFMRTATIKSGKKMVVIFEKEAKRQMMRLLK